MAVRPEEAIRNRLENAPYLHFGDLIEQADGCTLELDDEHFLRVSPRFQQTLGVGEEELVGEELLERVHPDDRALARAALRRVGTAGDSIRALELRLCGADERFHPLRFAAWSDGERWYAIAIERGRELVGQ